MAPSLSTPGVTWQGAFLALALATLSKGALASRLHSGEESFCTDNGWDIVWRDEFDGTTLNLSNWNVVQGDSIGSCRDALCTKENVYLDGHGSLVLRSDFGPTGGFNYTSGAVNTSGKQAWIHTPSFRACVRAQLPGGGGQHKGQGIWPAHWMMPQDSSCDPDHGEMDIMEMIDGDGVAHSTYHWQTVANCSFPKFHKSASIGANLPKDWASSYHEFAVERTSSSIR
jgi:beta-glucanase (GH16 family)